MNLMLSSSSASASPSTALFAFNLNIRSWSLTPNISVHRTLAFFLQTRINQSSYAITTTQIYTYGCSLQSMISASFVLSSKQSSLHTHQWGPQFFCGCGISSQAAEFALFRRILILRGISWNFTEIKKWPMTFVSFKLTISLRKIKLNCLKLHPY